MKGKKLYLAGAVLVVAGILVGLILGSGLNTTRPSTASSVVNAPEAAPSPDSQLQGRKILDALSEAFANVAEQVNPSVVTIFTESTVKVRPFQFGPWEDFFGEDFFRRFFPEQPEGNMKRYGLGSGVIIASDGIIVTNNHVIKGADDIKVRLMDGREFEAEVKGKDASTDLAVLKIKASDLPAIKIGDSDRLRVGEWVLAIGSPLGPELHHTVTAGIVSAKGRSGEGLSPFVDFIQTDAAINPGNSGGALVNLDGELVGINTAIVTKTGGFMGIGLAIPSRIVQKVTRDILEKGRVSRGWLGVVIQNVTPELAKVYGLDKPEGVIVNRVMKDSPAAKAGLKAQDIIVAFNGKPVQSVTQLTSLVSASDPRTTVRLTILRDGKRKTVSVKLGERPKEEELAEAPGEEHVPELGLRVENLTSELRERYNIDESVKGVVVVQLQRGSVAAQSGLRLGDVILEVNRHRVSNVAEFRQVIEDLKPGDPVAFYVQRHNERMFVAFTIPKKQS